jgi:hypothetical protein
MFILMPISTVIFFIAMYLCSIWFEAIEIGEIHVAFFKAFLLVFLVNAVGILPGGRFFTLLIWLIGLFTIFRCTLWEARVLIGMNWLLNIGAVILVMMFISAWFSGDDDGPVPGNAPGFNAPGGFRGRPGNVRPQGGGGGMWPNPLFDDDD